MYHLYVKTFIPRKEAIFMNRNLRLIDKRVCELEAQYGI